MKNLQYTPRLRQERSKGFTLIELLVVIAIIGILSGVVLASLNTARGKGSNAGVRTAFAQMRTEANLYLTNNDNYGTAAAVGSCATANTMFVTTKFTQMLATAQSNASNNTPVCRNTTGSNGAWLVSIRLATPEGANPYLCTDSTGVIKAHLNAIVAGTVCP